MRQSGLWFRHQGGKKTRYASRISSALSSQEVLRDVQKTLRWTYRASLCDCLCIRLVTTWFSIWDVWFAVDFVATEKSAVKGITSSSNTPNTSRVGKSVGPMVAVVDSPHNGND